MSEESESTQVSGEELTERPRPSTKPKATLSEAKSDFKGLLCAAAAAGGVLAGLAGAYAVRKYLIANRTKYTGHGGASVRAFPLKIVGTAEPGQLLEFDRPEGYAHFALYLGNGMVMNAKNELVEGILEGTVHIREAKLEDVCDGDRVRIRNHDALAWEKCFALPKNRCDIVTSALEMDGKTVEYQVFEKNCEYYATLWRYGVGFSAQADYFPVRSSNLKCMEWP